MNRAIIAALIAAIAIGGALGAFAATRTIETTATVEVSVLAPHLGRGDLPEHAPRGGRVGYAGRAA